MKQSHLCNNHICQYTQSQQTHTLLTILLDVVTENIDRYCNRKLGGTQSLSGSFGEKKSPLFPAGIRTQYQSSHTTYTNCLLHIRIYVSCVCFMFRFPSNTTSSEQMMPQYNNPGPSSSHYGHPYFQDVPLYSEQPTYTPFAMKAYSPFTERENAYHFQSEDDISDKESHYKQLKQSPSTSLPKSGHRVRFSFETTEKKKEASDFSHSISTGTGCLKPPKVRKKFRPIYILMELCSLCFCYKRFFKVTLLTV